MRLAPAPNATFSGVSGCRNPGVRVSVAEALAPPLCAAVIVTCTLSAVRYCGGLYTPALLIVPAPAVASPPLTDQLRDPEPAPLALNNSAEPSLQPLQLVSMLAAPGETENAPPEESAARAPPPQPASANTSGTERSTAASSPARGVHQTTRRRPTLKDPAGSATMHPFCGKKFGP